MPINRTRRMRTGLQKTPQRPSAQPTRARSTFTAQPMSAKSSQGSTLAQRSRPTKTPRISSGRSGMQRSASRRFNTGGLAEKSGLAGASIPLTDEQMMEEKMFKPEEVGKSKERKEEKMRGMGRTKSGEEEMRGMGRTKSEEEKMMPIKKNMGGSIKKKPPGLYANIHAKKKRIAAGSGEKMRKVGSKGAPTKAAFIKSAKTAKKG